MIERAIVNPLKAIIPTEQSKIGSSSEITEQFSQFLQNAIEQVNTQESTVHKMNQKFVLGEVDVDKVLIASEKATIGLQLTSQIRNKVIEAYQEIMRTQI